VITTSDPPVESTRHVHVPPLKSVSKIEYDADLLMTFPPPPKANRLFLTAEFIRSAVTSSPLAHVLGAVHAIKIILP
jgi:hypothetical protein